MSDSPPPPIPPAPVVHAPGYGGAPAAAPAYGEAPALRIANPGWRALAFVIDGFGTFALTTVIVFAGLFTAEWGGFYGFYAIPVVPVASFLLATILTATIGVTPGKALAGIRVVHVATGRPIGGWAIIRSLVIVSPLILSWVVLAVAAQLSDSLSFAGLDDLAIYLLPTAIWIALFVIVCVRPRHRGVEDILARSVVVRRR